MTGKDLKIFAGKGRVLRQLARDPEQSKELDQAKTDAEIVKQEKALIFVFALTEPAVCSLIKGKSL